MDIKQRLGLKGANLALTSFVAAQHPAESCSHTGLPLTPNSIAILGNAEYLKNCEHPNLCSYLDFQRGKQERVVCVSEYYEDTLRDKVFNTDDQPIEEVLEAIARQVLNALHYLEDRNVIVLNLSSNNIVFDTKQEVKLFNFGMGHMSEYGKLVSFPLFDIKTVAPEILIAGPMTGQSRSGLEEDITHETADSIQHILPAPDPPYSASSSVWSLGMILFARAIGFSSEDEFWPNLKISQILRKVLTFNCGQDVVARLVREFNCDSTVSKISDRMMNFFKACLNPNSAQRPSPKELLCLLNQTCPSSYETYSFPSMKLRCRDFQWPPEIASSNNDEEDQDNPLDALTLPEIYYIWHLAGGSVEGEIRRHGLMVSLPPILTHPKILLGEGNAVGQVKEKCTLYDPKVMILKIDQVSSCLKDITPEHTYPLLIEKMNGNGNGIEKNGEDDDMANLPLVIKERDVKYQFKRIVLYRRLLQAYPFTRRTIWKEARNDTLPLYRSLIWAALLGIEHDVKASYDAIDKEAWTPTDRQIEVDIPRCHQYNSLLASTEGHRKFKRVLKAWVLTNPQYVYWQGLDSLCAPFLYLNFNDEALAFACFSAFIPKYLHGMFRRDNSAVIQEYLAKFSHLQAFHDPILFNHLDGIGFIPDLYAIPWVLTMFAHVFPLQNIFHLWDKLLLGNASFPLCVALAILQQLRGRLLEAEFNDCILLFSDLPAIDIEQCVNDSIRIFCATPKSLTYRKHGTPSNHGNDHNDQMIGSHSSRSNSINPELTLENITLEMQKRDKIPRISGEELLTLLGIKFTSTSSNADLEDRERHFITPTKKSKAIAIDVRSKSEYKMGALPESTNIPFTTAFNDDGELQVNSEVLQIGKQKRSKVICIVGSNANDDSRDFGEILLKLGYHRICYLPAIEIFRSLNVLCVPDT